MVKTLSTMPPLGTPAPHFALPDVLTGKTVHFPAQKSYLATVICFICNHCPFVKHINTALVQLATDYLPRQVQFLAINSNDATHYPDDSPEHMRRVAEELHYPFPYLYDETQEIAHAYQAACTPDFFVLDSQLMLIYRGQLDDSRPGNAISPSGESIRQALDAILTGQPVTDTQKPSMGCNIKWKSS